MRRWPFTPAEFVPVGMSLGAMISHTVFGTELNMLAVGILFVMILGVAAPRMYLARKKRRG